jgi:hypothetical protein
VFHLSNLFRFHIVRVAAWWALQSFRSNRLPRRCYHRWASSRGVYRSFRVFSTRCVLPSLAWQSHFAVGHFPGLVVFRGVSRLGPFKNPAHPLVDFGPPAEYYPVAASSRRPHRAAPGSSSPGLLLPSAHTGFGGPLSAGLPPPATFRLQGLVTLLAVCSPRSLTGLISSRQRPWDSSLRSISSREVASAFPRRRTRMPLARHDLPRTKSLDRYGEHRLPGFGPPASPARAAR